MQFKKIKKKRVRKSYVAWVEREREREIERR